MADASSFAAGARVLGVTPAHVSKVVAGLEARLGARLLARTTRSVKLTDVGRAYAERVRGLADEFAAVEASVRDTSARPAGVLRLSVPLVFGTSHMQALLLDFAALYPDISLEVSYADRMVNLIDEGFDAALRIGVLADSSLVAVRLGTTRLVVVGAPDYFARHAAPVVPAELALHDAILDMVMRDRLTWHFIRDGQGVDVAVHGRLSFGRADACVAAAVAGFGVAHVPEFAATAEISAGRLRVVLAEFAPPPLPIHLIYPHKRHLAAKMRALVDFLKARLRSEGSGEHHS